MPTYKDDNTGKWYCKFYYTDYTGNRKQKLKRGFALKRDADQWERDFLQRLAGSPDMTFGVLAGLYLDDKKAHTKISTYETKKNRIEKWILPYFDRTPVNEITPATVRKWQTDLKEATGSTGQPLAPGYLQNIVMELSCVMNYAVRFYGLPSNPCKVAGNAVGKKAKSLNFWTKEEFDRFIDTFEKDDPFYPVFMVLYYTGMRKGELQALTPADIDLEAGVIHITKTCEVWNGQRHILPPKTAKSKREILIPGFLCDVIRDHERRLYGLQPNDQLFYYGKTTYANHLNTHAAAAGVRAIRVHDLRHSHASLLIELGFSALLIAERLGHESVSTTLDIYSHLFPSKQSEVVKRLEKLNEKNK